MKSAPLKSPVTKADTPCSALMYGGAFLILGLIFYVFHLTSQPRDLGAYSGTPVFTKAVIQARSYEKGETRLDIYTVRFPGNRGYLAMRTIYVPKSACREANIGPGKEILLELQDYKNIKNAVRTAATSSGCILYDERVRDEQVRASRQQWRLYALVMFVISFLFIAFEGIIFIRRFK